VGCIHIHSTTGSLGNARTRTAKGKRKSPKVRAQQVTWVLRRRRGGTDGHRAGRVAVTHSQSGWSSIGTKCGCLCFFDFAFHISQTETRV
jgi:hypothetical protein